MRDLMRPIPCIGSNQINRERLLGNNWSAHEDSFRYGIRFKGLSRLLVARELMIWAKCSCVLAAMSDLWRELDGGKCAGPEKKGVRSGGSLAEQLPEGFGCARKSDEKRSNNSIRGHAQYPVYRADT